MLNTARNITDTNQTLQTVAANVTLAQLNAGLTLVAPDAGRQLRAVGFYIRSVGGATTGLTDLRLSSVDPAGGTPTDIVTAAQANLTSGTALSEKAGTVTLGTGWNANLPMSHGLQVRKTGGTAAGPTSYDIIVNFLVVNPQ